MYTEEERAKFKKRFKAWKAGKKPYKNGQISDDEYLDTMERVARENWQLWGDESEDASLTRILNDNSYDYRGYYNKYPKGVGNAQSHWTDEFKTVWHPSFSIESKYSGKKSQYNPYGYPGGTWQGEFFTPLWYQQNPNAPGFYKDGYPRLPRFEDGKLPGYRLGTEGDIYMGPKNNSIDLELVRQTIHELPVSNTDPVGKFVVESVGATKGAKILGDVFTKLRLNRMADTYRQIRKWDSDVLNYTGKSLRRENIRRADEAARNPLLSRPSNPFYWMMDPIIAGYTKLQSHPVIGPLIPF